MPKKRDHGSGGLFYIKSRGLYRGVLDAGTHPDGRRRQVYVHGKKKADVIERLNALREEIEEHGAPIDKRTTFADWAQTWFDTLGVNTLKPNTYTAYYSTCKNWLMPVIGKKKVSTIRPTDVAAVVKRVADHGVGVATARKAHDVLSTLLEAAVHEGLARSNVAAIVDRPSVKPSGTRRALSSAEAMGTLEAASANTEGSKWWAAILYGIRQGERLGMLIESIDFEREQIAVEWSLDEVTSEHGCGDRAGGAWPCGKKYGAYCPESRLRVAADLEYRRLQGRLCLVRPKSGKRRVMPLIKPFAEVLRRHLEATAHLPNPHGLVWRHEDGSPFTPGEDEQAWWDLLLEAGVISLDQAQPPRRRPAGTPEPPTTHCARHTTATILGQLSVPPKVIGAIIGHVDERTTLGYQHSSQLEERAAMEAVGQHFAKALTA